MKAIVVYYSLDGNTEYVANLIAENLNTNTLRLETVKDHPTGNFSKFFWGGKSVVFGEKPALVPYDFDSNEYDTIIIGTPIWAGSLVPPIKTFINENNLSDKKIALFASSAGGSSDKCFAKFKQEIPGCNIVATLTLIEPKAKPNDGNLNKITEFCKMI